MRSLYYLARLLWRHPHTYYTHSASNFSRGADLRHGLMSGVEISTERHDTIAGLLGDLAVRRRDLARVSQGLICPIGNLPDTAEVTNTCGLHLHISGVDRQLAYRRLVRYLPAFALALAHAPHAGGRRFTPQWVAHTPADVTAMLVQEKGLAATYVTLDAAYRQWAGAPAWDGRQTPLVLGAIGGFLGYYLPRLPYTVWKAWREWS